MSERLDLHAAGDVAILVEDPLGRQVGVDPLTLKPVQTVPGSGYWIDRSTRGNAVTANVQVWSLIFGDYHVQVFGSGAFILSGEAISNTDDSTVDLPHESAVLGKDASARFTLRLNAQSDCKGVAADMKAE